MMKRLIKIVKRSTMMLALLLLTVMGVLWSLLGTESGRIWLVHTAVNIFNHRSDWTIGLGEITSHALGDWHLGTLRITQRRGVLVIVEGLSLRWQPHQLMQKKLLVDHLQIETMSIDVSSVGPSTEGDGQPFSLLEISTITLPLVHLKHLEVRRANLINLAMGDQPAPAFSIQTEANFLSEVAYVRTKLSSLVENSTHIQVEASRVDAERIVMEVSLEESLGGVMGAWLKLPGHQNVNGEARLTLNISGEDYEVDIETANLAVANHHVTADGSIGFNRQLTAWNLHEIIIGVDESTHKLRGQWTQQHLNLMVALNQLPLDSFSPWQNHLEEGYLSANLDVSGPVTAPYYSGSLVLSSRYNNLPLNLTVSGAGDRQQAIIERLDGRWGEARLKGQGPLDWVTEGSDFSLALEQLDLGYLNLLGIRAPASLAFPTLSADVQVKGRVQDWRGNGTVVLEGRYGRQPFKFNAQVIKPSEIVRVKQATLSIADYVSTVSGTLNTQTLTGNLALHADSLPLSLVELAGLQLPAGLSAQLSGDMTLEGPLLSGDIEALKSTLTTEVRGLYQHKPFALRAQLAKSSTDLVIEKVTLLLDEGTTTVRGSVNTNTRVGKLAVGAEALPLSLLELVGLRVPDGLTAHVAGDLTLEGPLLSGDLKALKSTLQAVVHGHYRQQPFTLLAKLAKPSEDVLIDQATLSLGEGFTTVEGSIDTRTLHGKLAVRAESIPLALLELSSVRLPEGLDAMIQGDGVVEGVLTKPKFRGTLAVSGQYHEVPFKLETKGHGQSMNLAIESMMLSTLDRPALRLHGRLNRQELDLRLNVDRLPARLMAAAGWIVQEGEFTADLHAKGPLNRPIVDGTVHYGSNMRGFDRNGEVQDMAFSWDMTVTTDEGNYTLATIFTRGDHAPGGLTLVIDQEPYYSFLKKPGDVRWKKMPLAARLNGQLDLQTVSFLLSPELHRLNGQLDGRFELIGILSDPRVVGDLKIANGRYHNPMTETVVDNIHCALSAEKNHVRLDGCRATDDSSGRYQIEGELRLPDGADKGMVDLSIKTIDASILRRPDIESSVTGGLHLTGDKAGLTLAGELEVTPLTATLDLQKSHSIPSIDVTRVGSVQAINGDGRSRKTTLPSISLDIRLVANKQAFLRGRGLEAELQGLVHVGGSLRKPSYDGELQTVRGVFEVFGKKFKLERGKVVFANNAIGLDVEGAYTKSGQEIRAHLTGNVDTLTLKLTSVPSMAEDEILAFIVFGKSVQAITPFEAVQLASAVQTLRGGGGTFDPIGSARKLIGVDTLSIETEENGNGETDVNVGIGKYLNEKVYLELQRTPNPSQPWKGNLQIEITPRLQLESSTGGKTGIEGAELLWKRDY